MDNDQITRKERERIWHRTEILSKALDLFSEKGFHNVSMQDIAVRSEYAVGTLYNFFQSKEQLFEELRNNCADKILHVLGPILETDESEEQKLRNFIKTHSESTEENLKFIKMYVSAYGTLTPTQSSSDSDKKSYEVKAMLINKIKEVVNTGIAKKVLKPIDTEIYVLSLVSSLQAFILESSKSYDKAKVKRGLANLESLFLDLLISK
ncbi:MAG: TetR/AcrR family transcriptional regulator [Phycisphaerales bacterium]